MEAEQLQRVVRRSLDAHLIDNAAFLAEQLYFAHQTLENRLLLAQCYLQQQRPARARDVLLGATSDAARYLLALAHFRLDQMTDAELALIGYMGGELQRLGPNAHLMALFQRASLVFGAISTSQEHCTVGP